MKKIKIKTDKPVSLSFAGGGSHGAWEAGALQALDEQVSLTGYVKYLVGTSTGSLIAGPAAAYVATGDRRYLTDMINVYRNVLTGNILQPEDKIAFQLGGIRGLLVSSIIQGRDSLFTISPLVKLTKEIMDKKAWDAITEASQDGAMDLGFCCVNMQTGQPEVFWAGAYKKGVESIVAHQTWMNDAMIASAAQPVVMDAQFINGVQYCDGGLTDANPARHLFPWINEDHTIIGLTPSKRLPEKTKESEFPLVLDQLERTLGIFVSNVYQTNQDQVEALRLAHKHDVSVHWLEPSRRIKFDALQFKQPAMSKAVDQGWADVMKRVQLEESIEV